jgi:hypothetical protein
MPLPCSSQCINVLLRQKRGEAHQPPTYRPKGSGLGGTLVHHLSVVLMAVAIDALEPIGPGVP